MTGFSYPQTVSKSNSILKILLSKRLLIDHLEILEECFNNIAKDSHFEYLIQSCLPFKIGCVGSLLSIAVTARFSRSFILKGLAATMSTLVLCGVTYMTYNNRRLLDSISDFIAALEKFDNAIKRNLIFVQEITAGEQHRNRLLYRDFKEEIIANCMYNCVHVIRSVFDYDKVLEAHMKQYERYNNVTEPLEASELHDLLTLDFLKIAKDQKNAKKLHHAFLYMQSHCLLQMGLALASDNTVLSKTETELRRLKLSLTECTDKAVRFLRIIDGSKSTLETSRLYEKEPIAREISMIRNQSLDLAVKLTVTAKDVVAIDDELQNTNLTSARDLLKETANNLIAIQANLLMRSDDCERLVISMKKLLNKPDVGEPPHDGSQECAIAEGAPETGPFQDNCVSSETAIEIEDEFFFLTVGGEAQSSTPETSVDALQAAEEIVAQRQMKRQFRPVLRQLRERLQPIELSFREREKNAMERKGMKIPVDDFNDDTLSTESFPNVGNCASAETFDHSTDDDEGSQYPLYTQGRYDEGRSLLANKQQFSFFDIPVPNVPLEENILE